VVSGKFLLSKEKPWSQIRCEELQDWYQKACADRDAIKAHADKLSEACKSIAKLSDGWTSEQMNYAIRKAQSALAAYEAAQR
jgi:hypothetical protein